MKLALAVAVGVVVGGAALAVPHPAGMGSARVATGKIEFNPVETAIRKQKIQRDIDELPVKVLLWMIGEWKP
jgi:hypothetical protein